MTPKSQALFPLFAVLVLAAVGLACGSGNGGSVVSTRAPSLTLAPAKVVTYNVGDVVQFSHQTITLNSAQNQGGILKANFTVVNKGTTLELTRIFFDAKDNDGTKLELSFDPCTVTLEGTISPGDKLTGDICWKTTSLTPFKLYYTDLWRTGTVAWEVK